MFKKKSKSDVSKEKVKSSKNKKVEVAVFGAGRFGSQIIENLAILPGYRVIAIDPQQDNLKKLPTTVDNLVVGDSSNEAFLEEVGLDGTDIFIIAYGSNIQASILTAAILKKKYPSKRIIAKASSDDHERILRQLGINEIINPEKTGAKKAIVKILNPIMSAGYDSNIGSIHDLEGDMSLVRLALPKEYIGKKVKESGIPREVTIVLVYRKDKPMTVYGDFKFEAYDEILLVAENKTVMKYIANKTNH